MRSNAMKLRINGVPISSILGSRMESLRAVEVAVGYCHVCGQRAAFYGYDPIDFPCKRNSFVCQECGSCGRNRHVAMCILQTTETQPASHSLRAFATRFTGRMLLACTSGALADTLRVNPGLIASEYIDGAASGTLVNGVLCQDLQATSFPDDYFDLVITEDVMEHTAEPRRAFVEIRRILRPGGQHICTIPVNWDRERTVARAVIEQGAIRHILIPEYHGDPTRPAGVLAFTEFGRDIVGQWCGITGPSAMHVAHGDVAAELAYGIYNSWVFISRKDVRTIPIG